MEGIQTFKGSWPWPWIRPYGIPSCITHRPLPIYQISFKSKKLCGRTDGRTDVWPDGHFSPYIIRSTFGSRPKNEFSRSFEYLKTQIHALVFQYYKFECFNEIRINSCCLGNWMWTMWPSCHTTAINNSPCWLSAVSVFKALEIWKHTRKH